MTNPTDNQTPQPVDELEQLIREIMQNGFEVAMGGLYDLTPEENEARQRAEYDRVTAEAKARLLQWGTRQRIDENTISRNRFMPGWERDWFDERIAELQASLKDGENQLGEKS